MVTQRWPGAWLLTDERLGVALEPALERAAAAGAGILIRHHASPVEVRRSLAARVRALGAPLAVARDGALAKECGALLVHNPVGEVGALPFSLSVHNESEAEIAASIGAALVFVSPVYPTRSHPGAPVLGVDQALRLARASQCPAVALGGMDEARGLELMRLGFSGWAGIDCWIRT
jgi:thiamine-phosphate pyrophosphorylase